MGHGPHQGPYNDSFVKSIDMNNSYPFSIQLALAMAIAFPLIGHARQADESGPNNRHKLVQANRPYKFKTRNNIFYEKNEEFELLCDLYLPEGDGPFPCVLAIHGGAWKFGDKIQMLRHAWKLAAAGYVVVSINYRHAPEFKFPAQVHDCKQAVRWIRSKADKLKIDPEKIAAFGYSAGGHLAAMLGTTNDEDGLEGTAKEAFEKHSTRVQCVVVGGGPCDFSWIRSNSIEDWIGDTPQKNPQIYKTAAPITYVTADDPPFLFVHGGGDTVVPLAASKTMHDKLTATKVGTKYLKIGEKGHFATFSDLSWMENAIEFMDEQFSQDSKKRRLK